MCNIIEDDSLYNWDYSDHRIVEKERFIYMCKKFKTQRNVCKRHIKVHSEVLKILFGVPLETLTNFQKCSLKDRKTGVFLTSVVGLLQRTTQVVSCRNGTTWVESPHLTPTRNCPLETCRHRSLLYFMIFIFVNFNR